MSTLLANRGGVLPEAQGTEMTDEAIEFFQEHGFVRVRNIIPPEDVERFHKAASEYADSHPTIHTQGIFDQLVNTWRDDEEMKALTLHPNIAAVAKQLAGVALRLWHDQILIKQPGAGLATEFHQDQPYWPHADSPRPISCWLALCDVPVERGCMTFLPGSHLRTDLPAQHLADDRSLFSICPELEWQERVTVPLRAGDCTFHHGRCAHMATPNFTDVPRVAHIIIFMDQTTTYNGRPHVVTDPISPEIGAVLEGELFPEM